MDFADCPDFTVCQKFGRHVHGRIYENYLKDPEKWETIFKNQKPTLFQKLSNVTTAIVNYSKSGFENCSKDEHEIRMNTCNLCPNFNKEIKVCGLCGCFTRFKSWMKSEKCPEGRWEEALRLAKEIEELHAMF